MYPSETWCVAKPSKEKVREPLGGLEKFQAWYSSRRVTQTGSPVSGLLFPKTALTRPPSRTPELTRQCIVNMVREKAPKMLEPEAGIRFTATCTLCKRKLNAVGSRDGRRSQFKSHWFGNMKCVRLRKSWTSDTYDMGEIESVFLAVQPVDSDKERSAYLLKRCASIHLLVDTLADWCEYMNGDKEKALEWITRALSDEETQWDAALERIDAQTKRLSAVMQCRWRWEYVRNSYGQYPFLSTPDNSDNEGPAAAASSSSGVLTSSSRPVVSGRRARTFTAKIPRATRNYLNTLD